MARFEEAFAALREGRTVVAPGEREYTSPQTFLTDMMSVALEAEFEVKPNPATDDELVSAFDARAQAVDLAAEGTTPSDVRAAYQYCARALRARKV